MYTAVVKFFMVIVFFTGILCGDARAVGSYDADLCELDAKIICYKNLLQDSSSEACIAVQSEMIALIMKISGKIDTLSCHDLAQHFSLLMGLNIRNKLWEATYEKMIYDRLYALLQEEKVLLLLSSQGHILLLPQFYKYMQDLEIPVHHDQKQGLSRVFCTPLNKKAEEAFFATLGDDNQNSFSGKISQLSGCVTNMCKKVWNRCYVPSLDHWSDLRVG